VASAGDGSCAAPLPLIPGGIATPGIYVINGNTSPRVNELIPTCNTLSEAKDLIYGFTVPAGPNMGIEARVISVYPFEDTVMELRRNCSASTALACSDDSTPPGGLFSRVKALLEPGDYILYVDGFSAEQEGEFELTVKFVSGCTPQCDGSFCGDDLCNGTCGTCPNDTRCEATAFLSYRCNPFPCTPDCTNKTCGDDGCGGSCGDCTGGKLCIYEEGTCNDFEYCNHLRPICTGGCPNDQYCGTDCQCYDNTAERPDFVVQSSKITEGLIIESSFFPVSSCAWYERCIGGYGLRRLLRFNGVALNQGFGTFQPPDPKTRPDLFQYSSCHNHYHFQGFALYELLNSENVVVGFGRKQGYCMEDSLPILQRPDVPCLKQHDCGFQGISAGWADAYGTSLDCQWIDITDLPSGNYSLRITVNPDRIINELSYENNAGSAIVFIPPLTEIISTRANPTPSTQNTPARNQTYATSAARDFSQGPVLNGASLLTTFGLFALMAVIFAL